MEFFLVKRTPKGRLRVWRSVRRSLIREEELVPRRKRTVLGFSWVRGSRLASSRFERAFLGLLCSVNRV